MSARPIHWTTAEALEQLAHDGGYKIEFGRTFGALVTREGTEFRAHLPRPMRDADMAALRAGGVG